MADYEQLRQITPLLTGFKTDTNQMVEVKDQVAVEKILRIAIGASVGDTVYVCRGHNRLEGYHYISEAVVTPHTKNGIPVVHFKRSDRISLRAVNFNEMGLTKEAAAQYYPYTKHGQIAISLDEGLDDIKVKKK